MKNKKTDQENKQLASNDGYTVLPVVYSWATFKKRNPDIQIYSVMDGTLGIRYTVEPTMRKLGYLCVNINDTISGHAPKSIDEPPRDFVLKWLLGNKFYHRYNECIYYVWHVRREYATRCIDVFLK